MRLELEGSGNALGVIDVPSFLHILAQSAPAHMLEPLPQHQEVGRVGALAAVIGAEAGFVAEQLFVDDRHQPE